MNVYNNTGSEKHKTARKAVNELLVGNDSKGSLAQFGKWYKTNEYFQKYFPLFD